MSPVVGILMAKKGDSMSWWRITSYFSEKPKDIHALRHHQDHKLAEYYSEGNFWCTNSSKADGKPTLLISSKPSEVVRPEYVELAKPAVATEVLKGTFKATKKGKDAIYEFSVQNADSDPGKKYLATLLKDPNFSVMFWNLLSMASPTVIKFGGQVLQKRKMNEAEWELCKWNLAKVLTIKKGEGVLDSEPIPGQWTPTPDGKGKQWVMPGGVTLAEKIPVVVKAFGSVVDVAKDTPLVAQMARDPVTAVMKEHGEKLKQKLLLIDEEAKKEAAKDGKKPKAAQAIEEALEQFEESFTKACIQATDDAWCQYVITNIEYKQYVFDCRVSVAKSSVTVTLGIVAAAAGGITGVASVLGLVGTIKGALDLANDLYVMFRDLDALAEELEKSLTVTLLNFSTKKTLSGFTDVGKSLLGRLPGGTTIQNIAGKFGKSIKDVGALEKDLKHYSGRVKGLLIKAAELSKKIDEVLKEAVKARAALDTPEIKEMERQNPELKKAFDELRKGTLTAEKQVTELLDKIADKFTNWKIGDEKAKAFQAMIDGINGKVPEWNKWAKAFLPLLDLAWGIDPENVAGSVFASASSVLEVTTNALDITKKIGEKGKQTSELVKFGTDVASGLSGIISAVKPK